MITNINEFIDKVINVIGISDFAYGTDMFDSGSFEFSYDGCDYTGAVIEQAGGGEGGAQDCYSVIQIDGIPGMIRIDYSYYSYNGFDLDYAEVYAVEPVERMVTFYEKV